MKSKIEKPTEIKHSAALKKSFNEAYPLIKIALEKRRKTWTLSALSWLDYDDVSQIILLHIYTKWHLYDTTRPLLPWVNFVIGSQIKNLIRNHYGNYSRPCLRCDAAEGEEGCKIYNKQCENCPLFAEWKKRKLPAHNIKLAVSIENHTNEVFEISDDRECAESQLETIHEKMKEVLKPLEYKVYEGLFILNEEENEVAKKLGYISNERGRTPGYKQIKNIRKIILIKIRKLIQSGDIDL